MMYTEALLRALGVADPMFTSITTAARLHDIGKIIIPDQVLNKPGSLSDAERLEIKGHAEVGANLLWLYPEFRASSHLVLHHHERIDGLGYPHGFAGSAIPFGARVIAVADTFDAMTSDRPYRKRMPICQAAQILVEGRGMQWDATLVDVFISLVVPYLFPADQPASYARAYSAA
jgi:HD-GYP domain-containing protein (c-di-GMP phosphodiesterase class II)